MAVGNGHGRHIPVRSLILIHVFTLVEGTSVYMHVSILYRHRFPRKPDYALYAILKIARVMADNYIAPPRRAEQVRYLLHEYAISVPERGRHGAAVDKRWLGHEHLERRGNDNNQRKA